ncbi:hypothetical protein [Flavisolibacter tropicus]|uniref:Uncharacterized protein n=1 Tax=Flavisolibacter tropicus TaxID=1492898 RepID=A0A172U0P4_9BACT|nr:hypothetical protein [Flavisolibacter tropicus]ANE52929.1 hypothetical protein SY85_23070 [Flavisolibacter tropicus]
MRKDPNLKRTMANADRFGVASKMVKRVYYRQLPGTVRKPGLFARLTGMVNKWLYQGKTKEEAQELLIAYCHTLIPKTSNKTTTPPIASTNEKTSLPENRSTVAVTPTPSLHAASTRKHKSKQARYLSHWKVKQNGKLHVPKAKHTRLPTSAYTDGT